MSIYRVLPGLNQPLIDLVTLDPQPMSPGVKFTRRVDNADGSIADQGPYIDLLWPVLDGGAVEYGALLTLFGLGAATTVDVTIFARNEDWQWFRFNGLAVKPQQGVDVRWNYFPSNLAILVKHLTQLAEP